MSGLDRLALAARRTKWTRATDFTGWEWSAVAIYRKGAHEITVWRTPNGAISRAVRTFGQERRISAGPDKAGRIVAWMAEGDAGTLASESPTEGTTDAVQADTEALKAAGVPVRTAWAAKGPEGVSRDLRTFAKRLGDLATDLDHAVAMHRIKGTGPTLDAIIETLETTRDGMDATVQGLGDLAPTVLRLWMELAYGTEFARKHGKASQMVREDF